MRSRRASRARGINLPATAASGTPERIDSAHRRKWVMQPPVHSCSAARHQSRGRRGRGALIPDSTGPNSMFLGIGSVLARLSFESCIEEQYRLAPHEMLLGRVHACYAALTLHPGITKLKEGTSFQDEAVDWCPCHVCTMCQCYSDACTQLGRRKHAWRVEDAAPRTLH